MRRSSCAIVVLLAAVPYAAADGMLDPSFGNGGLVTTNFPGVFQADFASALVVLPDGRAVAAGTTNNFGDIRMAVARYLTSGALDTSFSGDGMATVSCSTFPGVGAREVLLQPDGRLVLIGTCPNAGSFGFELARLEVDGSLDPSFGTGGQVFTAFPGGAQGFAGVLQPDGRIVAVGVSGPMQNVIAAARYNVDGSLDATFGTGGQLTLPLAQGFVVSDAALQADGKLVIGGTYGSVDFGLVRLLPSGAPDPSFDGDGLATSNFGGTEQASTLLVLADGRLVQGGSHDAQFAAVRSLANGTVDTTFGQGGLATAVFASTVTPGQLIALPNGKLLMVGTGGTGAAQDFVLTRFHADGSHDTSFGTGGFLSTDFNGTQDSARAVAIAAPDRVIVAGSTIPAFDFALARYIATTPVELLSFAVE